MPDALPAPNQQLQSTERTSTEGTLSLWLNCLIVFWHCWLGISKSIQPVKHWVVRCWYGYLTGARCKWWSSWCHCHPIISCFIEIHIGLTFLVPAYPGCPGKQAVKQVSVVVVKVITSVGWFRPFWFSHCYFSVLQRVLLKILEEML